MASRSRATTVQPYAASDWLRVVAHTVMHNRIAGSVTGLWALGLIIMFLLPAPLTVTPARLNAYESKEVFVHEAQRRLDSAQAALMHTQVELDAKQGFFGSMFPFLLSDTQRKATSGLREERDVWQQQVRGAEAEFKEASRDANRQLGLFSNVGIKRAKELFWDSFERAKIIGRRNTFFDGLFAIIFNRDHELLDIVVRLAIYLVTNMFGAMFFQFWFFLFSLPSYIWTFGATWYEGLVFFVLATIAAASVMLTFLGLLGGAATGTVFGIAYATGRLHRLEAGGHGYNRRRLRGQAVPGYSHTQFGGDHYYRAQRGYQREHES